MSKNWVWAIGLVLAGAASACGGDDDGGGDGSGGGGTQTPRECEPANTFTCVGAMGCRGVQICNRDGTWGSCSCGSSSGGQGGSGSGVGEAGRDGGDPGMVGDAGGVAGAAGDGSAGAGQAGDGSAGAAGDGEAGSDAPPDGDEDCDNNQDDDDDGDVDCADDDCGERICARTAPDGWDGPAVFFAGDLPDECPNAYDDELARGGLAATAEDADCDTCTCTPSSPDCASFLTFGLGADDDCGGVTCPQSVSASCIPVDPGCLDGVTTAYLEPLIPSGVSSCSPSGQTPSLPDAEWTEEVLACASDGLERGGCSSNSVCAPALPADATLCILREGDHDCPDSGPYTERAVIYTDIEDDRTCSDCECDHDCDYEWNVYAIGDTSCATAQLTLTSENQCAPVSPSAGELRLGVDISGTGDCQASGGEPEGGVTEGGAITVCCDG